MNALVTNFPRWALRPPIRVTRAGATPHAQAEHRVRPIQARPSKATPSFT